jgi:hypothetical protein
VHEASYPIRKDEYGPILASVLEAGRTLSGSDYQKILLRRMDFCGRVAALLSGIDLLLTPVHPFAPLTLDTIRTLGEQPELIAKLQRYTCSFDMAGSPTLTHRRSYGRGDAAPGRRRISERNRLAPPPSSDMNVRLSEKSDKYTARRQSFE